MAVTSINTVRLTGLTSGMDTDALVKNAMQIEQLKLNRQLRSRTLIEWKQTGLNDIAAELKKFQQTYMSALNPANMLTSGAYNVYNVTKSGSKADAVTVSADPTAKMGTLTINRIHQVATSSSVSSKNGLSNSGELAESNQARLMDLDFKNALIGEDGKIAFSVNGVEFTFNLTDTLSKVMSTINSSECGATMSYSRLTDKFTFSANKSGEGHRVVIGNLVGNAFGPAGVFGIDAGVYDNGQNAIVEINGVTVEKTSNTFTIDGMKYTLHEATEAGESIKLNVTRDIEPAVKKIKEFIEAYNALVKKLDDMLVETKTSREKSYTPLTEEEKSAMTDKQVEEWEAIAKKGLFYNDQGIQSMLNSLRGTFYDAVTSAGVSPNQIGIKTGNWGDKGQILLDETALRIALEKDPEQVMNCFANISGSADEDTAYAENGFINRINILMNKYVKESQSVTLETMQSSLREVNNRISALETRMSTMQERLYLKYSAMESALANLESQTKWFENMMSSITGAKSK